jgi:cyclic-di-GMP phosphodiesterase TipF (flagellum assembly factor)
MIAAPALTLLTRAGGDLGEDLTAESTKVVVLSRYAQGLRRAGDWVALGMIRISTIFIAICMVLIAASLGLVVHAIAGLGLSESGIVALATLSLLILYNAISMRLREQTDVGGQIAVLSRGTADLARQVGEVGRRLVAIEHRVSALDAASQEQTQMTFGEIGELGSLVKQLAISIAGHDELLTNIRRPSGSLAAQQRPDSWQVARQTSHVERMDAPAPSHAPAAPEASATVLSNAAVASAPSTTANLASPPRHDSAQTLATLTTLRKAIETNRIDIYLQPLVTLPQRKVRFYEAVSRIRDEKDQLIAANDFIAAAEASGLMGDIDRMVLLRCVQVLRRLLVRNKDVGLFCNLSSATLSNPAAFAPCLDFLEANRSLAPSLVLEFKQSTLRGLGPIESEHLAALAQRGYRFSVDNVSDLRLEPRDLADRGVRFIKVPAPLLLDQSQTSTSDIHPADLSDLLGRFGIDLVAERIEGERAVVDLLDYDVRFGQGFLFSPPRPLRPESIPAASNGATPPAKSSLVAETAKIDPARMTGKASLARRAIGPN